MNILDANHRLTKTTFLDTAGNQDTELFSFYECPRCHERVGFERKHFEKHLSNSFTNLSQGDSDRFDRFAKEFVDELSFLDFYCQGCKLPVRIYFSFSAG